MVVQRGQPARRRLPDSETAANTYGSRTPRTSFLKTNREESMGNRLYVGNLSFNTSQDALRAAFAECGEVSDVHIVTDRETGQPRGFGFVTMGTSQEAEKAMTKMNGATLDGRQLRVNEAEERPRGGGHAVVVHARIRVGDDATPGLDLVARLILAGFAAAGKGGQVFAEVSDNIRHELLGALKKGRLDGGDFHEHANRAALGA